MSALTPTLAVGNNSHGAGLLGLTFAETGAQQWVTNYGTGSPGGSFAVYGDYNGTHYNQPTSTVSVVTPGKTYTINQTYVWGTATVTFTVNSDNTIEITGSATNNTGVAIPNLDLYLCKLTLGASGSSATIQDSVTPGFLSIALAGGNYFTFAEIAGWNGTMHWGGPNWGDEALYAQGVTLSAGATVTWDFRLGFWSAASDVTVAQNAAIAAFAIANPQLVYWYDRRPIGQCLFTGGGTSTDISQGPNPRNWFNDQSGHTTILTTDGLTACENALVARGKASADNVVTAGGQGLIYWDTEGAGWPQGLFVYGGDPRLLDPAANPFGISFAPEMNAVIDQIVAYAVSVGLKVGFCLRMNTVANYSQYPAHSYSPYVQNPFPDTQTAINDLAARVQYCQNRWGSQCCLFYVDSAGQAPSGGLNNFTIWKTLQQMFPDCFFAPEQNCIVDYAYASVYLENRGGSNGTSSYAREIYPQAFTLLNLANYVSTSRASVLANIIAGDIPLFECWWGSPEMSWMEGILSDAKNAGWTGYQITTRQQMSLLTDIQNAQTANAKVTTDISAIATGLAKVVADLQQMTTDAQALSTTAASTDVSSVTSALTQARTDLGA